MKLLPNRRAGSIFARTILGLSFAALLAACAGKPSAPEPLAPSACPPATACPACPVCPAASAPPPQPPQPLPEARPFEPAAWSALPEWNEDDHAKAWPAVLKSCERLARNPDWGKICAAARRLDPMTSRDAAREFLEHHFVPWAAVNPDGTDKGLVTGYFEPLIEGSRERSERYAWPVHGVPEDMLTIDLGDVYPELRNMRLRGRVDGNRVVPYWTRGEIDTMGEQVPASVMLWAADPIDLFFLQVQGSGQVSLPDGSRARIGYADQNGHPYQSIGRWLVAQGELPLERASMQGIKNWARENPGRLAELLHANPSYVFFRELPVSDDGPIGALGVPLTPERSIAIDPRFVPLGAPVFLDTTYPLSDQSLRRLMVAQDTGGAIKGAVRADFFWGFGDEAGARAGRMRQQGRMWVLLPRGVQPPMR